jgi:hypothetical protein
MREHSSLRYGALVVLFCIAGCAQRHPPPGSQYAMAEILLRHELVAQHSHLGPNGTRCPCYVLVGGQDLPAEHIAALAGTGALFLPGSTWSAGKGLRVRIGLPRHRWNGNFDVALAYDCGPQCEEFASSIMRYDGSRWRVIR